MPEIYVLGGGYAGLRAVRVLNERLDERSSVTLVDRCECHQLLSRLPELVVEDIAPHQACIPFTRVLPRRVRHLQVEVDSVNVADRTVTVDGSLIQPDWLIIALGSVADSLHIPGAAEYGLPLKSVNDAVRIRDKLSALRANQEIVRVVVVGAGYTGTELAGVLAASNDGSATHGRYRITVVALDHRILPQGDQRLADAAERHLSSRDIPLLLGQKVHSVDSAGLSLENGEYLPADLIVWAAQSRAAPNVHVQPHWLAADGRIEVDPYLRVNGDEHTYACGDIALVYDYLREVYVPASGQLAMQEGEVAASNVAAAISDRPLREFRARSLGEALTLGGSDAIAMFGGVIVSGRAARAIKQAALARYLLGLRQNPAL